MGYPLHMAAEPGVTQYYDRVTALEAVDGDAEMLDQLTELFLQEGALVVGQMRREIASDAAGAELKQLAHKLAGAAVVVGAALVYTLARGLEFSALERPADELRHQIDAVAQAFAAFESLHRSTVQPGSR